MHSTYTAIISVLIVGAVLMFIVTSPLRNFSEALPAEDTGTAASNARLGSTIPRNAFVQAEAIPPKSISTIPAENQNNVPSADSPSPIEVIQKLQDIGTVVFPPRIVPYASEELLSLPAIPSSELALDPAGVKTVPEYLEYFATHAGKIQFPYERLTAAEKNSDGILLAPTELVGQALARNSFAQISASFTTLRDLVAARISYLKSIKVASGAITANQTMIGFDQLTLQLLDKALAVGRNELTLAEFKTFYEKYRKTGSHYNRQFSEQSGLLSSRLEPQGFLARTLDLLGLLEVAHAVIGFGGRLSSGTDCPCSAGFTIFVTGTFGGQYFVYYGSVGSAVTGPIRSGSWVLGLQNPGATCLTPGATACSPAAYPLGTVILAGAAF